jgi:23S rRNA pseudouridine2457 synthase
VRCVSRILSPVDSFYDLQLDEEGVTQPAWNALQPAREPEPSRHPSCRLHSRRTPANVMSTAMRTTKTRTLILNKPYGVLPCFTDSKGRSTLADYIDLPGVYAAGRLDRDSEGLMILTSDGSLAHRITDPTHKLPKVYWAQVERIPDQEALNQLRRGVLLSGARTRPAEVRLLERDPGFAERPVPIRYRKNVPTAWLEITLHEGMNRQVRRMTAAVGHPTLRLVRVAIGPMVLGDLRPGQWRGLTPEEVTRISQKPESGRKRRAGATRR